MASRNASRSTLAERSTATTVPVVTLDGVEHGVVLGSPGTRADHRAATPRQRSAALSLSVPPLVNTTSPGWQPIAAAT